MDVKDFCSGMENEMTAWKAKLYDTMRKVDKLGTAEKEKMLANVEDLHILLQEMSDRVEQLKTECPSDWSPVKKDIDKGTVDMRSKYEETMEAIGKASPVSIAG
jgi:predicted nuclease with TOPRIM domain